jgi:hypothetical protein
MIYRSFSKKVDRDGESATCTSGAYSSVLIWLPLTSSGQMAALGNSLADVAAFMHEMELDQGLSTKGEDQRGIERLRLLGVKMSKGERALAQGLHITLTGFS